MYARYATRSYREAMPNISKLNASKSRLVENIVPAAMNAIFFRMQASLPVVLVGENKEALGI